MATDNISISPSNGAAYSGRVLTAVANARSLIAQMSELYDCGTHMTPPPDWTVYATKFGCSTAQAQTLYEMIDGARQGLNSNTQLLAFIQRVG